MSIRKGRTIIAGNVVSSDWTGTLEEYNIALKNGTIKENWICYITDDEQGYISSKYGSDIALLDIIVSNQLLEGKDLVGKVLQGSMVLGSEYPDAYNKLLANKNKSASMQVTETIGGVELTYTQCLVGYKILDISNKDKYDQLFEATGTANFFVLDETNKLFYLPKTNNFLQPNTTISEIGEYNEAGLPNIEGHFNNIVNSLDGARTDWDGCAVGAFGDSTFSNQTSADIKTGSADSAGILRINASLSNPIYGNSPTVQPQSTNVFIYYKVGNTIQTDASIDLEAQVLNLQQRNNIPFTLLESKYSEIPLNNTSWLLSNGLWYDGTIYEAVYDKLIGLQEKPEEGFSVKLNTEEYTDYDFVLNLEEETFRLPLKNKRKYYQQSSIAPVVGNGMALGLTDGVNTFALSRASSGNFFYGSETAYGTNIGSSCGSAVGNTDKSIGVTTDASKSGIEANVELEEVEGLYLYYYVGETNTDVNIINTGKLVEKYSRDIDNKLDKSQITNCLLEVPQRIKYTLEDGTLTIKAGSVVIVPYGTEDLTAQYPVGSTFINDNFKVYDTQFTGGKFFVWAELVSDITGGFDVAEQSTQRQIYITITTSTVSSTLQHISGDNPTTTTVTWTLAYNTSTNLLGRTDNNTVFDYTKVLSLPIMHVVSTTHAYGSIEQVFNGMGYIGSTAWLDKGVKGLIPNGRNEDGSLNNIEFETPGIVTRTTAGTETNYYFWCYRKDTNSFNYSPSSKVFYQTVRPSGTNFRWYNPETNIWQVYGNTGNLETRQECPIWHCSLTNGAISSFQPKQPANLATRDMVDGQWIYKAQTLTTATALGEYTLDLSEYLPNDGYIYEILCRIEADQNTDSANAYAHIQSDIIPYNYITVGSDNTMGGVNLVSSGIMPARDYLKLVIASTNMSYCALDVVGYRRIGTNT